MPSTMPPSGSTSVPFTTKGTVLLSCLPRATVRVLPAGSVTEGKNLSVFAGGASCRKEMPSTVPPTVKSSGSVNCRGCRSCALRTTTLKYSFSALPLTLSKAAMALCSAPGRDASVSVSIFTL